MAVTALSLLLLLVVAALGARAHLTIRKSSPELIDFDALWWARAALITAALAWAAAQLLPLQGGRKAGRGRSSVPSVRGRARPSFASLVLRILC